MRGAQSPPEGVKSPANIEQVITADQAIIHGGRPWSNYGPPPALFHPALAKLDYHLKHLEDDFGGDDFNLEAIVLHTVHLFIQDSLNVYETQDMRELAVKSPLDTLLQMASKSKVLRNGAKPDMTWGDPYVVIIQGVTNEFGFAGDACLQAQLSYARVVTDPQVRVYSTRCV